MFLEGSTSSPEGQRGTSTDSDLALFLSFGSGSLDSHLQDNASPDNQYFHPSIIGNDIPRVESPIQ